MKINRNNFWENTQGVFPIEIEGDFYDLITYAVNKYKNEQMEVNFNQDNDAFYLRFDDFAVRIANRWGKIGDNCDWTLNRDYNTEKYQLVIINYSELNL